MKFIGNNYLRINGNSTRVEIKEMKRWKGWKVVIIECFEKEEYKVDWTRLNYLNLPVSQIISLLDLYARYAEFSCMKTTYFALLIEICFKCSNLVFVFTFEHNKCVQFEYSNNSKHPTNSSEKDLFFNSMIIVVYSD